MKEQLICELVKSGKDAELMNKQYAEKIKALEKVCTCGSAASPELQMFYATICSLLLQT